MPRIRTPNFHDARLSVAQSCIRENVVSRSPGGEAAGLFAAHPMMQAAGAVLERVDRGEISGGDEVVAAYRGRRAAQKAQGVAVATVEGAAEMCMDLAAEYVLAWAVHDTARMAEVASEWKENVCDPGWLKALGDWLEYYGPFDSREPHYVAPANAQGEDRPPYASPAAFGLPAPASPGGVLRVGVLGDWGTGEPEALAVLDQLMKQAPDLLVHVGDVYYAGTKSEQTQHFLEPILAARAQYRRPELPVYTLPGNHDYYSGGAEFYGMLAGLNQGVPGASVQANSFFCLRNDHWQLQGMDTGYHDHDLPRVSEDTTRLRDDEAAWHQQQLAGAGGRAVILLSHHQPFSAFEKIAEGWRNPALLADLSAWTGATGADVVAWLWGHEHVLEVYAAPPALPVLGRCVGNSAFPVFTDSGYTAHDAASGVPTESAKTSPDGTITFPGGFVQSQPDDLVWASGYAVLELGVDGEGRPAGTASYYQVRFGGDVATATSQLLWQEPLPAAPPAIDVSGAVIAAKAPAGY